MLVNSVLLPTESRVFYMYDTWVLRKNDGHTIFIVGRSCYHDENQIALVGVQGDKKLLENRYLLLTGLFGVAFTAPLLFFRIICNSFNEEATYVTCIRRKKRCTKH